MTGTFYLYPVAYESSINDISKYAKYSLNGTPIKVTILDKPTSGDNDSNVNNEDNSNSNENNSVINPSVDNDNSKEEVKTKANIKLNVA